MSTTIVIIFVLLIIISMMMYYCLCDKRIEGFNTAGSNASNLPEPPIDEPPIEVGSSFNASNLPEPPIEVGSSFVYQPYSQNNLTVLIPNFFFDGKKGIIIHHKLYPSTASAGIFYIITGTVVPTTMEAKSNLFVTDFRNNLGAYNFTPRSSVEVVTYRPNANNDGIDYHFQEGITGTLPQRNDIQPTDSISFGFSTGNDGSAVAPTSTDIAYMHTLVFSKSTLGINDSTELGEGLLMSYNIITGRLLFDNFCMVLFNFIIEFT